MEVEKNIEGTKITLSPVGMLDTANAPIFEKEVDLIIDSAKELIIDFIKTEYISSSGLRILLKAQKKMNVQGSMIIKNANESIKEVFELTGFAEILNVE